jgi:hypothetical protein
MRPFILQMDAQVSASTVSKALPLTCEPRPDLEGVIPKLNRVLGSKRSPPPRPNPPPAPSPSSTSSSQARSSSPSMSPSSSTGPSQPSTAAAAALLFLPSALLAAAAAAARALRVAAAAAGSSRVMASTGATWEPGGRLQLSAGRRATRILTRAASQSCCR